MSETSGSVTLYKGAHMVQWSKKIKSLAEADKPERRVYIYIESKFKNIRYITLNVTYKKKLVEIGRYWEKSLLLLSNLYIIIIYKGSRNMVV